MTRFSAFRVAVLIAVASAMAATASCNRKPAAANASPFPESNQVQGWTRSDEIRVYPAGELWKYIDGDAEKYVKAGVQSTSTADYHFQNKIDAVVDLYSMANSDGTKTVFESEPAADASSPQIGDAARLYAQSLVFRRGKYLVRIVAYQESQWLRQGLLDLGKSIDQRLSN